MYQYSAQRLALTFQGEPEADTILLPFLTLYRHAYELKLKDAIRIFVKTKIDYITGPSVELEKAMSVERMKKLGHNLHKLLNEAHTQYADLDMNLEFPSSIDEVVLMFHEADETGQAFRYAGGLPQTQEYADFPDLLKLLDEQFEILSSVIDYVDGTFREGSSVWDLM